MEKKNQNGQNSVAASAQKNNKGMYTYGNESDCTFFKTKKEAKEYRKDNFGSLYASEAEMDRLIPIRKVVVGYCGFEKNVVLCN